MNYLISMYLTLLSTLFQLYRSGQSTYPCFPGFLLTSTPHSILSKPLAAFQHNQCRNKGQRWERNESSRNDYHQSSERILAEPGSEPVTSCSQICNTTSWAMELGAQYNNHGLIKLSILEVPYTTQLVGINIGLNRILSLGQKHTW